MAVKVRQRKGKWWILIDYKGTRKAKCIGDSQRTARLFAEKMEAALILGQFDLKKEEPHKRPFDSYFTNWLETDVKAHCKERTYDLYKQAYRLYLLPAFGQKDIGAITRDDVKKLAYGLLTQGKSHASVRFILAPLSAMFRQAIEDGHLSVHPATRILRHVHTTSRKKADFLTEEEAGRVLCTCREHFPASYPLISLLLRTGLRLGEALALKWEVIDFAGRFIDVRHTLTPRRTLSTPKSKKTRRVDMSLQLTETLKALLLERKKETLRKGWGEVPSWVFISEEGTHLHPGNLRTRVWAKLLAKAELRHVRLHDLRHTYASLLIQHGESLAYVKEQMGHHSIKITVDTYGHLMPGGNKAAVDRLDGLENAMFRNPGATNMTTPVLLPTGSH